jgi:hypothetical protein
MRKFKALPGVAVVACLAIGLLGVMSSGVAAASPIYLCLTEKAGAAKSGGVEGKCPAPTAKVKYAKVALPKEEAEQQTLLSILPHVKYLASGVGGKPTIQFSGVNVQVVNGEGKTASVNGDGNLVIGYDENASRAQTGSHNLILGEEQAFSSFGGIVAGFGNTISGREASVSGGFLNTASGFYTSISGGEINTASREAASVSGGVRNTAGNQAASVQGGSRNLVEGIDASIFGGKELVAKNEYEAIP